MMLQKILDLKVWKKRPFYIVAAFLGLLILLCVVKLIIPCREYRYEGAYFFEEDVAAKDTVVYGGIALPPGVYRVELDYEAGKDLASLCNVADGTVFTGGLLSNGEHLYRGLEHTGYDMWLYESTKSLQVVVSYGGSGGLATGNLRIVETKLLWTMLLTIIACLGMAAEGAVVFYYYDRSYPVAREKKNAFFFVAVIGLIASVPYLCGYNITGADLTYHLQRIEGVKDGLLGGQFPVRLEPGWVYGHGYANAIFYCNTFLYFPALLRMLGFTVTASYNAYCIVLNIATAGIAYYCFDRIFGNRVIGLACSALYTLSIFRIYKLVVTSAVGEGTAVTFLPLVIYGLYRVFAEDPEGKKYRTAWVPLMLGIGGVLQSHVLTCEITALVVGLFCLLHIRRVFRKNTFAALAKGAAASVLLSLWFLVPFLDYYVTQDVHIRHVSARTIQDRGLYFAQLAFHFWTTGINTPLGDNGMQYSHPVGIGLVLIVALGVFLILWFSGRFRNTGERLTPFVKAAAVIGALLLYMSTSAFPWDRIQFINSVTAALVSSLQFPNRFLGWGTVCLVLVFGFCMRYFHAHDRKYYRAAAAVAVLGIATSGMYLLDFVNANQEYYELYNEESMGFGYISGAEYLIEGTEENALTFASAVAGEGVEILSYGKNALRAELECVNDTAAESFVDLPLLLYKGYRAVNADTGQRMQLGAGENNLVRVTIPAHFHGKLNVAFVSPVYWRISEAVSLATLVLLAALWRRYRRNGKC